MWWQKVTILSALVIFCVVRGNPLYNDGVEENKFEGLGKFLKELLVDDPTTYRLPNDSLPISYEILLNANIKEGDFSLTGVVNIKIMVVENTDKITLHSRGLNITKVDIVIDNDPILSDATFDFITTHDFLIINLRSTFNKGTELRLDIYYNGKLRDDGAGFFWARYNNSQGETKYYGATQFEIFDARSAFPCYDEPGIRAVMTLTIIHDVSLTAVANTAVSSKNINTDNTKYITQFEPTPKIQTYLLAFLVSDFEYVDAIDSKIPQKIYGTPMAIQDGQGNFAASVVGPILHQLEEILSVSYPLSKMDHVAIVSQFSFSAMENFGLIIYIDSGLLLNPALGESATFNQQNSIISLITHEYSHQWFGNIVSPKWWQYTWLNEGFATFFANYIPELIYSDRKSMRSFFSSTIQTAFNNDGPTAWSMNHYTEDPKELWTKFNGIGYQKSGCVIRMFMEVMTAPVFFKGLTYYLNENYMKAATPDELHISLQKAYDETIPEILIHFGDMMSTWENQAGYPLLTVKAGKDTLVFLQRRYPESNGEVYSIPITFAHKSNPNFSVRTPKLWLPVPTLGFTTDQTGYSEGDWMVVNIDQVGYYRVDYDTGLWRANIKQLNADHKVINELNRALLLDEFYLAWTEFDRVNAVDALKILNYFDKEDEYLAWARGQATYNVLRNRLFGTPTYEIFAGFIRQKAKSHLDKLGYEGFDGEDPHQMSLRSYTKQWSCQSLDGTCYLQEYQKFIAYYNGVGQVNFNFCYAMKLLDEPVYTQIVLAVTTNSAYANRADFVQNLGCSLNPVNLNVLMLQIQNSGNNLSNNERENLLISMFSSSGVGLKAALDFIDASYEQLSTIIDLSKIMSSMVGYINGDEMTAKFREVVDKLKAGQHLTEENHQSISSILESNEKWIDDNYEDIFNYFETYNPTTYRLPENSIPISYDIILNANIKEGDFSLVGIVNIKIKIVEATNKITLHSRGLDITKIDIIDATSMEPLLVEASFELVTSHDFLVINLGSSVEIGTELQLDIYYNGELRDDGAGFYWASYNNSQGETKFYGATQFEIFDARSAFPCYDEPGIRAVMTLTIIHDVSLTAVANTAVSSKNINIDNTKYITQFEPTPLMQTYLLAFVVSDFEYVNATDTRIPQKIYGTPKAIQDGQGNFAASVVGPILRTLEEVLNVSYPLSKMDHVALTKFNFGAMENFGLITYIDRGLLLNPELSESGKYNQQGSIISLITHEYAHQWFGDIVSPKWWQYTWLNEGFATFFANYIPSLAYPERRSMRSFFSSTIQTAFNNDGPTAWSMNHYTEDPKELWTKFNGIGYQKSGCVIRMFMEVMTEPVFFKGLNYYLTQNYMKAATPDELHISLQKAYDETIPEILIHFGDMMSTWENQAGYPLLTVKAGKDTLVFSQRRYPESNGEVYSIPITFAHKSNSDFSVRTPKLWLPVPTLGFTTEQTGYSEGDWMVVNIDQVGYYRVDYDTGLWRANIKQLNADNTVINPLNRALLLDEFYLGWTEFNRVNGVDALNILNYFDKEDEYLAWARGQNTYNILRNRLFGTPAYKKFTDFVRNKAAPHLANLGYEGIDGENPDNMSLRSYTKQWSCQSLDGNCFIREYLKFIAYYNGTGEVNFNYCYAMKFIEDSIFAQIVLNVTSNSAYPNREGFIQNLGCSLNSDNLYMLQSQVLNNVSTLSKNERQSILISMFSNSEIGLEMALSFIDSFHMQLSSYLDLSTVMNVMSGYINGEVKTATFRGIVEKLKSSQLLSEEHDTTIKSTLDSNEKWNKANYYDIALFFELIEPTTQAPTTATTVPTEPSTKPNSGNSVFISISLIALCAVMNLMKLF
ncbi:hypothetical protein ACKWTF_009000 [Chironomus riparius]